MFSQIFSNFLKMSSNLQGKIRKHRGLSTSQQSFIKMTNYKAFTCHTLQYKKFHLNVDSYQKKQALWLKKEILSQCYHQSLIFFFFIFLSFSRISSNARFSRDRKPNIKIHHYLHRKLIRQKINENFFMKT